MLSSCETKISVWHVYTATCEASRERAICYKKFVDLWQQFHTNVVVVKPMTDLCLTCQQNTTTLFASSKPSRARKIGLHQKSARSLEQCTSRERVLSRNLFERSHDIQPRRRDEPCSIQWRHALLL